jgi:cytochrome c553
MNALVVALVGLIVTPFMVALRTRGDVPAARTRLAQEDLYRQAMQQARLRRAGAGHCTHCHNRRARDAA